MDLQYYVNEFNTLDWSDLHLNNNRPATSSYNQNRYKSIRTRFPILRTCTEFIYWVKHSKDLNFISSITCPICKKEIRAFGRNLKTKQWGYLSCCRQDCYNLLQQQAITDNLDSIKKLYIDKNLTMKEVCNRLNLSLPILQIYLDKHNIKKSKEAILQTKANHVRLAYKTGKIDIASKIIKTKKTFEEKYGKGIVNAQQVPAIKIKTIQTAIKNGTNQRSYMEEEWLDTLGITQRSYPITIDKKYAYVVDGYDALTNTIYEFLGDFWHANPKSSLIKGRTFTEKSKRFIQTKQRFFMLKHAGYNIKYIWESDWKAKSFLTGRKFIDELEY